MTNTFLVEKSTVHRFPRKLLVENLIFLVIQLVGKNENKKCSAFMF